MSFLYEIISLTKQLGKIVKRIPVYSSPRYSVNIFYNHSTMIKEHWHYCLTLLSNLIIRPHSNFASCLTNVLFGTVSSLGSYAAFCHVFLVSVDLSSSVFFFFPVTVTQKWSCILLGYIRSNRKSVYPPLMLIFIIWLRWWLHFLHIRLLFFSFVLNKYLMRKYFETM